MDLFHVQRYFGEGEDRETNSETQKKIEDARLKELKKKIRKRKKEKRTVCEAKEESSSKAEKGDSKCKKKVKLKTGDDVSDQKGRTSLVIPVTISDSGSGTSENNIRKSNLKHKLRESEPDHEIKNAVESYKPAEFGDLLESMKKSTESDTKVHTSLSRSKTKQIHINNKTESNKDVEKESSQSILQGTNGKERSEIDQDQYFTVLGHTHKKQKGKSEVKITLPSWLAEPTLINANINSGKVPVSRVAGLSSAMMTKLAEQDIEYLFPVQSTVIPFILSQMQPASSLGKMGFTPSDICVSAPTGSGKTLAYVLPILQTLSRCTVRRLQALMILPTKDLASQIKKVVDKFAGGMNIRTGLASGIKSFQSEQEHLITNGPSGFISKVDILVATPGRLVDHITHTEGFSLEHLRFLVIDEADRLLSQAYHSWLGKALSAAYKRSFRLFLGPGIFPLCSSKSPDNLRRFLQKCYRGITTNRKHSTTQSAASSSRIQLPLQKLLFSATLTQSPEKLAPLQLFEPILFAASGLIEGTEKKKDTEFSEDETERYITPEHLTEKMAVCSSGEKPLILIYMMKVLHYKGVLCFTGSIEATHRLFLLLKSYGGMKVAEFSSTLNQTQRKGILRDFKSGKINLLICSDAMARGMDIENVEFVISYDPPANVKTYVHRVGRTARAGQSGTAVMILSANEVYHFKKIIRKTNKSSISKLKISNEDLEPLVEKYEKALQSLEELIKAEKAHGYKTVSSELKDTNEGQVSQSPEQQSD